MKHTMTLALSLLALSGCIVTTDTFDGEIGGRGAETILCTPGALVEVGCGALGLFVHELDCGESGFAQLERNDDFDFSTSRCPGLDVFCPESGLLAVRPTAFGSSDATCFWDAVE